MTQQLLLRELDEGVGLVIMFTSRLSHFGGVKYQMQQSEEGSYESLTPPLFGDVLYNLG